MRSTAPIVRLPSNSLQRPVGEQADIPAAEHSSQYSSACRHTNDNVYCFILWPTFTAASFHHCRYHTFGLGTLSYHYPVYRSVRKQYVVSSSLPDITHSNHAAHLQTSINLLRIRKVDRVPESDVRPLYCLLAYSSTLNPTSRELDISYNAYTRLK
jgi:hypothetical protein